jgi:pimeloyl-ACP methyl ester carboxylesterase
VTALVIALACVFALWAFTAVAARRIEARYPATGKRVEVEGGAIHVLDRPALGPVRGTVLMIHGASGNASDLDVALGERLSQEGFRTLCVDRPGHGWSARIGGRADSSPALQADAIRRTAERLGVAEAIVVAHSLGGITALAMALDAPDFVRALVLIAPVSHPWPGGVAWYYRVGANPWIGAAFRRLVTLPIGMASMRSAVARVFAPNPAPQHFIDWTRLPLVLRPLHFRANCEDVASAQDAVAALSPRYGSIRAPTEIATGDRDGVVSADIHASGLARDIPDARLTILPGVGHSPHYVAPERIMGLILEVEGRASQRERRRETA